MRIDPSPGRAPESSDQYELLTGFDPWSKGLRRKSARQKFLFSLALKLSFKFEIRKERTITPSSVEVTLLTTAFVYEI